MEKNAKLNSERDNHGSRRRLRSYVDGERITARWRCISLEDAVRTLAFVGVLVGLLLVWFASEIIGPAGGVVVEGVVQDVSVSDKVTLFVVAPTPSVPIIRFGSESLSEGARVRVVGRLQEFRGNVELVAQDVTVVSAERTSNVSNISAKPVKKKKKANP